MKERLVIWLPLLLFLTLLSACDGNKQRTVNPHRGPGTPAYGDSIVVGSIGQPSTLIPLLASDSASHDIASLIYNGLVRYDKNLKLESDLAESWDISPDGLTITFHL